MALNLTPCVYPLIPITVSYFGGPKGQRPTNRPWIMLHCWSIDHQLRTGRSCGPERGPHGGNASEPLLLAVVSVILVFFATSLFGLWELRLPSGLTRAASKSYAGYFGTLFMGLTLGVVAAPCIGPFVLGLLTWVAGMGSPWLGFVIFFTLSLRPGSTPLFPRHLFRADR